MAVLATLSQRHLRIQNPTVNVHFHFTDGRIRRGQILIRAAIFTENGKFAIANFNVVTMADQLVLKLNHSVANRTVRCHTTILLYKFISDIPNDRLSNRFVLNLVDGPPQNESEISIVLPEMPQPFVAHTKHVMRPAAPSPDNFVNNQPLAFQSPKPLSHSRRCHADRLANLLNGPSTHAVKLFKEVLII